MTMPATLSLFRDRITCDQKHFIRALRSNEVSDRLGPPLGIGWSESLVRNVAQRGLSFALASAAFSFFLLVAAIAQNEFPSVIVVGHPAEISPDLATQIARPTAYFPSRGV